MIIMSCRSLSSDILYNYIYDYTWHWPCEVIELRLFRIVSHRYVSKIIRKTILKSITTVHLNCRLSSKSILNLTADCNLKRRSKETW